MIPMGKKALIRGKLRHTNEITVSHGNGMFSDCSQIQAIEILNHRLNMCATRLRALEAERSLYRFIYKQQVYNEVLKLFNIYIYFRNKLEFPKNEEVFGTDEGQEIIEDYDEKTEQKWRKKHAENVKNQKQMEAVERAQMNLEDTEVSRMLEDYELMEELADELDNLQINGNSADTLAKLISGKSVPDSKLRIAHDMEESPTSIEYKKPFNACDMENFRHSIEKISNFEPSESTIKVCPEINNNNTEVNNDVVNLLKSYRSKLKDILKSITRDDEKNLNVYLDLCELKDNIEDDIQILNGDEMYSSEDDSCEIDSDDNNTLSLNTKIQKYSSKKNQNKRKVRFSSSLENVKIIENKEDSLNLPSYENYLPILIEIHHSENKFTSSHQKEDIMSSPADIYNKFHNTLVTKSEPTVKKSILKSKNTIVQTSHVKKCAEIQEKTTKKIFKSDVSF